MLFNNNNNDYVLWGSSVLERWAFVLEMNGFPYLLGEVSRNFLRLLLMPTYPALLLLDTALRGTPTAKATILYKMLTRQNTKW